MNRQTLKLTEVIVPERFRKDYGDLTLLKDSISKFGLIQPICVNQNRILVAGGRRYAAHVELNLSTIDVVYKETLAESERQEMEALENIARKSFNWQEECVAIYQIHMQRQREAALSGSDWNSRLACELFGVSKGALSYVLVIAKKLLAERTLKPEERKYHQYSSCFEAYRLGFLGEQEKIVMAELAKRHISAVSTPVLPTPDVERIMEITEIADDFLDAKQLTEAVFSEAREKYLANPHNPPELFEEYWRNYLKLRNERENTVYLSGRVVHGDSITWMLDNPNTIDHIITDIPYGIDMEMLNQQNPHEGLQDLDRVADEHDVAENITLMQRFFPAAFTCTKEKAFVITYLDIMNWQLCYDLAIKAGFAVQRWPLIWHKQSGGMNQCANYNSTKNYDILMLCRKPGTTFITGIPSSIILASHEEAKRDCGHPFSKPYAITKQLVEAISIKGALLLEPFAGRGSVVVELLRQERRVIAIEKQTEHYNALLENVKRFYLNLNPNAIFK